jgi:uncharacterized protein (UPF0332 family)
VAGHDKELLEAARDLLQPRSGRRGKLPAAKVRRCVSTIYHALFHFVLDEATRLLVGTHNDLRWRRNTLARTFSHAGLKTALDKISGRYVDSSVADLLRPRRAPSAAFPAPAFASELAVTFSAAQAIRHQADYDLNKAITEYEARTQFVRVQVAIATWQAANTPADRDFKQALCMLMLLKGELRREN